MRKIAFGFLKYHLLHQDNFLAHVLGHVTHVTPFNKCSNPNVKLEKSMILYYIRKAVPKM